MSYSAPRRASVMDAILSGETLASIAFRHRISIRTVEQMAGIRRGGGSAPKPKKCKLIKAAGC